MTTQSHQWILFTRLIAAIGVMAGASAVRSDTLVFQNVRVFDGTKVIPGANVIVGDGTIAAVGAEVGIPNGATVIDGRGKTLLPGLIDAHTHAFTSDQLRAAVMFGVTTELDMFTSASFAAERRAEQAAGKAADRADLYSAGTLITAPGGHGTEYGVPIPTIASADQADAFVAARVAEGSDYIKIVYDDGSEAHLTWKPIDEATLAAVIRAAKARKKLAVVHILAREFARRAVDSGADGLVHLWYDQPVDAAFVRLAADRKTFVIPTLTVLDSVNRAAGNAALADDPVLSPYLTPDDIRMLRSSFPGAAQASDVLRIPSEAVKALKAAGVRILAGTDCSNPGTAHGASLHRELALLVAAGLTPAEAITAATATTADAFHLADRGRIAPGLRADLLLVDGDPTVDIAATRKIAGIWKQGRPIDRDSYRAEVRRKHEAVAKARTAPPPPGSEGGLISDFEGEKAATKTGFGAGWMVSTDVMIGGKSKAQLEVVDGGAGGSNHAMKINGTIAGTSAQRWAGVFFSPGMAPMTAANLSGKAGLSFSARGDGQTASVMVFSQARGFVPVIRTFVPGKEWKPFHFAWKDFDGLDGTQTLGIFFGGGTNTGPFEFRIDDVRLDPAPVK